jgi:hypothetical protein
MSHYREIVVQTYNNPGEPSSERIRARPVAGQGLSTDLKVECSSKMREGHPPGTLLIIRAKLTDREGTQFLYSHYNWRYRVVTAAEAERFIREQKHGCSSLIAAANR